MREFLDYVAEHAAILINGIALIVVAAGTLEAFGRGVAVMLFPAKYGAGERDIWMRYARWLVAGLTFQLGADIIETSISPTWDQIGRIGAVAVIRTFLNYFLERDIEEWRERRKTEREPPASWGRGVPGQAA